jgi:RimJ/RimL family protein N-acetyltransferase
MWNLAPRLVGEIAILEPLAEEHFAELLAASRFAEIWTWWPLNPGADEQAFRNWFDSALARGREGTEGHFATLDARSGRPIGSTSFGTAKPHDRGIEIGWTWLTPAAWSTGANAEAKLLQLRYAFEDLGCIRVEFETDEHNERSRRALQALPAQFEGILRDARILPDGRRSSLAYYSILESEWPEVRRRLAARVAAHGGGPGGGPPA